MSERYRNDLYYIERLSGDVAIHPDGIVGRVEEKKAKAIMTVKGRREDRVRKVAYIQDKITQTTLYDNAAAFRIADKECLSKNARKYSANGEDSSWSVDDMPDKIIARFNKWQDGLTVPAGDEIADAARALVVGSDELQNATIECMWCHGGKDSQYACRGCGRTGAYYKYPIIRVLDGDEYRDTPFDVASFVQSDPGVLSYEVRTMFNHEGKMAAEQLAVLNVTKMGGLSIDPADQLYGEITIPITRWREDPRWPYSAMPALENADPYAVIEELQKKCALELVRERLDQAEYQESYDQFMQKIRALGGSAMTAVVWGRRGGMDDGHYELLFGHLPFADNGRAVAVYASEKRDLFKKVLPLINVEEGTVDIWWDGGY